MPSSTTTSRVSKMCEGCGGFIRFSTEGKKVEYDEDIEGFVCSTCKSRLSQSKKDFIVPLKRNETPIT